MNTRPWSPTASLSAIFAANVAAWFLAAACSHGWDAYDPRISSMPDASTGADATADGYTATDAGMDADARPGHVTADLLALYDFEEGQGNTVSDVSGLSPALDLTIADPGATTWIPGALSITNATIVSSPGPATKVIDGCKATNEITLEVWFRPASLSQGGPARLITNSVDPSLRNFQLGQEAASYYQARLRSTQSDDNGAPFVETPPDDGDVTMDLTHLLYTRDVNGVRRLYVNAVERASDLLGGDFSNWDMSFGLALANEFTMDRTWLGELHRVAVYSRALTPAEVAQSYGAGP